MAKVDARPANLDDFREREPQSSRLYWFGVTLYVTSFFLPAVWFIDHSITGFGCAKLAAISSIVWITKGLPAEMSARVVWAIWLGTFGGLINLLAIVYFLLRIFGQTLRTQMTVAWAILAFMVPMWVSLYLMHAKPFVGHAVWILGLLLMIFQDIRVALVPSDSI
jgi:hypothetical protein